LITDAQLTDKQSDQCLTHRQCLNFCYNLDYTWPQVDRGQGRGRGPYDLLFGQRKAPDGTRVGRPTGGWRTAANVDAQRDGCGGR